MAGLSLITIAAIAALGPARGAKGQPLLEADVSCEPALVRPDVPALISCTLQLTNAGDETAPDLVGTISRTADCAVPGRFVFVDAIVNGELRPQGPVQLSTELGDLGPGETLEASTRLVATNFGLGLTGGAVSVVSETDPFVGAEANACWEVAADAELPPSNLQVTTTLRRELASPAPAPLLQEPPPRPEDGSPVPIETPGGANPDQAQFEIVVTNVSAVAITDLTILEAQLGSAVFAGAEPPASELDPIGRPVWDLSAFGSSSLGPGEELRLLATSAPPAGADCSFAENLVMVTATPAEGSPEAYAAFADAGMSVGPCGVIQDLCWHYPPEGEPVVERCDAEVWWAEAPEGGEFSPVADASGEEYCWFLPPGEGAPALAPCAEPVCWSPLPASPTLAPDACGVEVCEYTAPDGSASFRDACDAPVCWTSAPGSGAWQTVDGCGEAEELCWFTPPGEGEPVLRRCSDQVCWLPVSDGGAERFFDVRCTVDLCQYTAPDGSLSVRDDCTFPVCWSAPPEGGAWQPVSGCGQFDQLCWFSPPGDAGPSQLSSCRYPVEGSVSTPAEIVAGTAEPFEPPASAEVTPAQLVEGTVELLGPLASAGALPAELVRTEPLAPPPTAVDVVPGGETPSPPEGRRATPVAALPDTGADSPAGPSRPWAVAFGLSVAALFLAALGLPLRRGPGL